MVRERDLARPQDVAPPPRSPACETEWCGARNGRARARRAHRRAARPPSGAASPRAPPRGVRLGQDRGQAPGQHRLAGAGRTHHQDVVAPGGGHLEGAPRLLPAHGRPRGRRRRLPRHRRRTRRRRGSSGRPRAPQEARPRRPATRRRRRAGRRPAPPRAALAAGTTTPSQPCARRRDRHGQHARRRHQLSLERQLAGERVPGRGACDGHLGGGGEHTHGHRQVEARALLAEVAGREVDHDATQRPLEPGALDCRPDRDRVASRTAAPGSPVRASDGSPRPTCASTVTRWPPTPEHRHPERPVRTCERPLGRPVARRSVTRRHGSRAGSAAVSLAAVVASASIGAPNPTCSTSATRLVRGRPLEALGEAHLARGARLALRPCDGRRPCIAQAYPEAREALLRARAGRPAPAPMSPTPSAEVLAEFRERVAPHTLQRAASGLVQLLHAAARCRCRSPARCSPQWIHQGVDVWHAGRSAPFVEEEVTGWLRDLVGLRRGRLGRPHLGRRDGQHHGA